MTLDENHVILFIYFGSLQNVFLRISDFKFTVFHFNLNFHVLFRLRVMMNVVE